MPLSSTYKKKSIPATGSRVRRNHSIPKMANAIRNSHIEVGNTGMSSTLQYWSSQPGIATPRLSTLCG